MNGSSEHWYVDDQFARQLGDPAHAAVIERRWSHLADALRGHFCSRTDARPLRVLDIGCGDGINLVGLDRILSQLGLPARLFAADMSAIRTGRVAEAGRAPGALAMASVTALPFATGAFDVVLCNHVIEHVPGPGAVVTELARVLRPGGLAIIGVPNEGCAMAWLRNHVLQRSVLKTTDHVNFFTRGSLLRLLGRAPLVVEDVRAGGLFVPHHRLSRLFTASPRGRALLDLAGRLWPSQAADLTAIATRRA